SPWWAIHTGSQADEWRAFELAGRLDYRAAVESISMGRPQIMGFNHARVGYPTAEAMFAAFARRQDGEAAQIIAMLNYMLSDAELVRAIRQRDWREIARRYNGSGSVETYSPLLEAAWRSRLGNA
ncbi:MAG: N-acetylmuramidase domain-containing protein, partial [Chloroflexota bacterium]|nr:N-acetylmuramidase domain-containing protein [Chloroflexota bacterium]